MNRQSLIIIGVTVLVCLVVGFFLLWPGLLSGWTTLSATREAKKELAELVQKKKILGDLSKNQDLTKLTATATGYIPEDSKSSDLILELTAMAGESKMTVEEMSLESKAARVASGEDETAAKPKTTVANTAQNSVNATPVDFTIKIAGDFPGFLQFLRLTESSARLINLEGLKLANEKEKFTAEIEGKAYWKKGTSLEKSLSNIAVTKEVIQKFTNLRQYGTPVNTSTEAGFGRTNPFEEVK